MLKTLRNAWKIPDLRRKILFTVLIIVIYRIGCAIPAPFVDVAALSAAFSGTQNSALSNFLMFSGGNFEKATIFALGISPFINASIIMQLLTVAIPPLERLAKEGEAGRKKINQITKYVTIGIALLLGISYFLMIGNQFGSLVYTNAKTFSFWFAAVVIVLVFVAGASIVNWLGERVNENGIGNGISIILLAGIISRLPRAVINLGSTFINSVQNLNDSLGQKMAIAIPISILIFAATIVFIVFITDAERRIPVQYAKRVVGRKVYGGQNSYIPIKVNMSGVMPAILATSIISLPGVIFGFIGEPTGGFWKGFYDFFQPNHWFYTILFFVLIIAFAYFYVAMQYNPTEMANDLRKNSGAIPGYRPGKPTSDYIARVLSKVTLIGALCLGIIAVVPMIFGMVTNMPQLAMGGTSIMIVVGVALETTQQLESQMMMRHYKGFLQ